MANHRHRRRVLVAVIASVGLIALWWISLPNDDPRLYGTWRFGPGKFRVSFGPDGQGTELLSGTSLEWWVDDGKLRWEYLPPAVIDRMQLRLRQLTGKSRPAIEFAIIEIHSDVVLLRNRDGVEVPMTREKPPATHYLGADATDEE